MKGLLVAVLCLIGLWKACGTCTIGFPPLDTIKQSGTGQRLPEAGTLDRVRLWLFPSLIFNCTGNITRWIFQAEESLPGGSLLQIQTWRENKNTTKLDYLLQSSSGSNDMLRTMDNSTFELMLTQPVPIEPGDILGVELPGSSVEMLRLHFQDRGIGMAPISYQSPEASYPLFDVGLSAPNVQYLPLITPVIGSSAILGLQPTTLLTPTHTGPNAATQLPSRRHTPSFVILPTVVPEKNSGEASFTAILVATTALLAFSVSITAVVVVVIIYLRRRQRKTDLGNQRVDPLQIQTANNEAYIASPAKNEACVAKPDQITSTMNKAYGVVQPVAEQTEDDYYSYIGILDSSKDVN